MTWQAAQDGNGQQLRRALVNCLDARFNGIEVTG